MVANTLICNAFFTQRYGSTERDCAALSKIFLTTPRITFRCGQKVQGKRKKSEFKS